MMLPTERERERPGQFADELDDEHQRLEPDRDPGAEVGEIAEESVLPDTEEVDTEEDHQGQGDGRVQVRGRRHQTGDEPEQVADQDVEKDTEEKRVERLALGPD
jgi:hypothetical protein